MVLEKVNQDYSLTGNCDNTGEGFRVLARMIARRLMENKSGMNRQHPDPTLSSGIDVINVSLQSPRKASRKQEATRSRHKRLHTRETLKNKKDYDG